MPFFTGKPARGGCGGNGADGVVAVGKAAVGGGGGIVATVGRRQRVGAHFPKHGAAEACQYTTALRQATASAERTTAARRPWQRLATRARMAFQQRLSGLDFSTRAGTSHRPVSTFNENWRKRGKPVATEIRNRRPTGTRGEHSGPAGMVAARFTNARLMAADEFPRFEQIRLRSVKAAPEARAGQGIRVRCGDGGERGQAGRAADCNIGMAVLR